ncbi:MAG: response regulator [Candidatus Falkowbacteria bacterium]
MTVNKNEKFRILVLEDEPSLQEVVKDKLTYAGFEVFAVNSVHAALAVLDNPDKIDAIWLDHYLLGESDGLDFVIMLKSSDKFKNIPIFVVSNTASPDKIQSYIHLGVTATYVKADVHLADIINDVKKALA